MKVVIMDSGVDEAICKENIFFHCLEAIQCNGETKICEGKCKDEIGHGTAVCSVFFNQHPDVEYFIIKIFDKSESDDVDKIIAALDYVLENIDEVDLIHVSNGCVRCDRENLSRMKKLCEELADNGTVIVSAFDNEGAVSYPAAFHSVIGVEWDSNIANTKEYIFYENSLVDVGGIGSWVNLPGLNGKYKRVVGSSFSAPYISAIILQYIKRGATGIENIREKLREHASRKYRIEQIEKEKECFEMKKAIVFPFNKEVHSLIRKSELLLPEILHVYDTKYSGIIGVAIEKICHIDTKLMVEDYLKIDWESDFDTVILGNLERKIFLEKTDYLNYFLDKCAQYGKNIYAFDNLKAYTPQIQQLKEKNKKVFFPEVNKKMCPTYALWKMFGLSIPVLAVVGTSSKQGKYTLQLSLRKKMEEQGYKVGHLSTEPTGKLFGSKMLSIGYGSNVQVNGGDIIGIANQYVWELEEEGNDIIVVGTQGPTIHLNRCNIAHFPLLSTDILLGTQPDGAVLCVNMWDQMEYIKRTIVYLESVLEIPILVIALFAVRNDSMLHVNTKVRYEEEEIEKKRRELEQYFGKKVFIQGKDDEQICNNCIAYFSSCTEE